jgi:hypothetical protein
MNASQVELWAANELARVTSDPRTGSTEDALVELKKDWPDDPARAARRIAAHANAAHGSPILWLVGVDELTHQVAGVEAIDFSTWWPRVRQEFESEPPSLIERIMQAPGGETVVALCFLTDLAPYVVKNPVFGTKGGGPVRYEIPWRSGTAVESATRYQLLMILAPAQRLPRVDIVDGELQITSFSQSGDGTRTASWELDLYIYVQPQTTEQFGLPFYDCTATHEMRGLGETVVYRYIRIDPMGVYNHQLQAQSNHPTMQSTNIDVVVSGPGLLKVNAVGVSTVPDDSQSDRLVHVTLKPTNFERAISLSAVFANEPKAHFPYHWRSAGGKLRPYM